MKKIILIIVTVAILLGAAYYYFFWRNKPIAPLTTAANDPSGAFPSGTDKTPGFTSPGDRTQTGGNVTGGNQTTAQGPGSGASFSTSGGQLSEINNQPISGKTLIKQGTDNFVLFTNKATGQVYLLNLTKKTPAEKITNTTITKTNRSLWTSTVSPTKIDSKLILQYQNRDGQIEFFTGTIPTINSSSTTGTTTNTELLGSNLIETEPIVGATTIEDRDQLFYLTRTNPGDSLGYVYDLKTKTKTLVWQSPLNEWLPQWLSGTLITMQTKAAAGIPGSVYLLNTSTRAKTKLVNDKNGLVATVSPSGDYVIYSEADSLGITSLKILSRKTNRETIIPLRTIADKCVWNKKETVIYCGVPNNLSSGKYPDDWYSGTVGFTDSVWYINNETGQVKLVFDPTKTSSAPAMDIYQPILSTDESILAFTNKHNLTLWTLDLVK